MHGIFTTGKVHNIFLMINLAGLIYSSIIVLSHHAEAASPLSELGDKRGVNPEIFLNRRPFALAVNDEGTIFATLPEANAISIIDGNTLTVSTLPVGIRPIGIAVDDFWNRVFVANRVSNTVSVIEETEGGYRNVANVTVLDPLNVFVEEVGITYVINSDPLYPVSVLRETSNGVWRNVKNISLEDSSNIVDIATSGNITFVGRSYSSSNHSVSIIEDLEGAYRNVTNVSIGFAPELITAINGIAYVANFLNKTISKIEPYSQEPYTEYNYNNTANITLEMYPVGLSGSSIYDRIFVTNSFNNNVSVYYGSYTNNYINVANITVGDEPFHIVSEKSGNLTYVANENSESLSVINGLTEKSQVGVSFEAEPSHAGYIDCKDGFQRNIKVPTNQYVYVDYLTPCTAKANEGFQFSSWSEDLGNNSTRIINASTPSNSPIDWLTDALTGTNDTTATLTPTKFGKFVARFEAVPPPFPPEYLIPLYGIIASSIVGWSIPSIVSWFKSKKEGRNLYSIHNKINRIYDDGKVDHNDTESLDKVKIIIENEYSKGNINTEHYTQLNDQISVLYHEIYKKLIDSFKPDNENEMSLAKIREDVEDAYAKGKLNELHYNLLDKKLKSFEDTST